MKYLVLCMNCQLQSNRKGAGDQSAMWLLSHMPAGQTFRFVDGPVMQLTVRALKMEITCVRLQQLQ